MALVYLRHPIHGEKAESNDLISYLDLKAGWVKFDPIQEAADKAAIPLEDESTKEKTEEVAATIGGIPDFFNVISKGKKKP